MTGPGTRAGAGPLLASSAPARPWSHNSSSSSGGNPAGRSLSAWQSITEHNNQVNASPLVLLLSLPASLPHSLAPLDPLDEQQQASPPPETLDQLYEGLGAEADASTFAGHELYRALRGDKGDDPLADELLWEGDFMFTQRDYIQRKQEDELLERLERRMGEACSCWHLVLMPAGSCCHTAHMHAAISITGEGAQHITCCVCMHLYTSAGTTKAKPMQQQVRVPSAGGAPPGSDPNTPTSPPSAAIAGLAAAAATGVMNLLGRVMPEGSRGASVDDPSRRVSALSPAMSSAASLARYGSGFSSAPGQLTPPSRLSQLGDGPTPSAQDSPAAAAAAAETVTPRPFLERVTSSFRRCSSVNDRTAAGSAVGALGVLVAEDEAKRKAAEALPAVETPASGQLSVSAGAGEAQPADAIVQVCAGVVAAGLPQFARR
jgi:hypothetical protein